MQPIIGVTASLMKGKLALDQDVMTSILQAGGIPCILPYATNAIQLDQCMDYMDGLLLSGGDDIDPTLFGEEPLPGLGEVMPERDQLEINLIRRALQKKIPIFAICRGMQILNVAAGGNMYQDLPSQKMKILQHSQKAPRNHLSHFISITKGTLLSEIIGLQEVKVNSFHHQAAKDPAPGFIISAVSSDGVAEAIESRNHPFVLGVQWHPENLSSFDIPSQRLFKAFVSACKPRRLS